MRAAVLEVPIGPPVVTEFEEPKPVEGSVSIDVTTAGLGGWDVLGAYREEIAFPCVVRGEGVGRAEDGRRVYFGERSLLPYGAWAERTVVPAPEVWDIPDEVDDTVAIAMAIAGTGAFVPLEQAAIQPGERVLVLGATGTLGQLGLQFARRLGAGAVAIGGEDDVAALQAAAGDGYDVVLDVIYGAPFVAALKATRPGARVMSIGVQAGITAPVFLPDLLFRTHTCVGTGQRPPSAREAIWRRLLDLAVQKPFVIDTLEYDLDDAPAAWTTQQGSPHANILCRIAPTGRT